MKSEAQRLLELIYEDMRNEVAPVPPGWHTVRHYIKEWGFGRSQTERYIKVAIKKKLLEHRHFKVVIKGRPMKISHYRATK
jgi:hypothetical protein